jgi:hypothetical protein
MRSEATFSGAGIMAAMSSTSPRNTNMPTRGPACRSRRSHEGRAPPRRPGHSRGRCCATLRGTDEAARRFSGACRGRRSGPSEDDEGARQPGSPCGPRGGPRRDRRRARAGVRDRVPRTGALGCTPPGSSPSRLRRTPERRRRRPCACGRHASSRCGHREVLRCARNPARVCESGSDDFGARSWSWCPHCACCP